MIDVEKARKFMNEGENLLAMLGVFKREGPNKDRYYEITDAFMECLAKNYEEIEDMKASKWSDIDEKMRDSLVLYTLCDYIDVKQGLALLKSGKIVTVAQFIRHILDIKGGLKL